MGWLHPFLQINNKTYKCRKQRLIRIFKRNWVWIKAVGDRGSPAALDFYVGLWTLQSYPLSPKCYLWIVYPQVPCLVFSGNLCFVNSLGLGTQLKLLWLCHRSFCFPTSLEGVSRAPGQITDGSGYTPNHAEVKQQQQQHPNNNNKIPLSQ